MAPTGGPTSLKLSIQELEPSVLQAGRLTTKLRIYYHPDSVVDDPRPAVYTIHDYFNQQQHDGSRYYLDEALSNPETFKQNTADGYANRLKKYGEDLFKQLRISAVRIVVPTVEINVFECPETAKRALNRNVNSPHSIFTFHWELLEHVKNTLWPECVNTVIVRRIVIKDADRAKYVLPGTDRIHYEAVPRIVRGPTTKIPKPNTSCRILLVVARRDVDVEKHEVSPSVVKCVMLQLLEELNLDREIPHYYLEIVRPGTFEELATHLDKRGDGFFQVLHFDMHGLIETEGEHNGKAVLEFAKRHPNGDLRTSKKPASDIAGLLVKRKVPCAVLNACDSARTDAGDQGNLSKVFLQQGVPNVLAMSYKVSDTMFNKFFTQFYGALFRDMKDFSEAATLARHAIEQDQRRLNSEGFPINMRDWFVPVTYCNGTVIRMTEPGLQGPVPSSPWTSLRGLSYGTLTFMKVTGCVSLLALWLWAMLRSLSDWPLLLSALHFTGTVGTLVLAASVILAYHRVRPDTNFSARLLDTEVLDKNVLRIESRLTYHKTIYLYAFLEPQLSRPLIQSLTFIWNRTHFIERAIVIPAEWFLQYRIQRVIRQVYCYLLHVDLCCFSDSPDRWGKWSPASTVIIITHMDVLFSRRTWSRWYYTAGQRRLLRFLTAVEEQVRKVQSEAPKPASTETEKSVIRTGAKAREKARRQEQRKQTEKMQNEAAEKEEEEKEKEKQKEMRPYLFFAGIQKQDQFLDQIREMGYSNVQNIEYSKIDKLTHRLPG